MRAKRLTKRELDAAAGKPPARELVLHDGAVTGLVARVYPSGRIAFAVRYRRSPGSAPKRMNLGSYGALTLDAARELAQKYLAEVAAGADPLAERQRRSEALTVRELAVRFQESHLPNVKPSTAATYSRQLRRYVLPAIGSLHVAEVDREAILRLFDRVSKEKPIEANRVLALCSKLFSLAELWGLRPPGSNPAQRLPRNRERQRHRNLTAEELARLGAALREAEQSEPWQAVALIRLLILTGARVSEWTSARWRDVDLETGRLQLPDSKTGAKTMPLGPPAVKVLASLRREGAYVLPGFRAGRPFQGIARCWQRIRSAAQLSDLRLHDLRHAFAGVAAAQGESLRLIAGVLGHSTIRTTERYTAVELSPVAAVADRTSRTIAAALAGERGELIRFPSAGA